MDTIGCATRRRRPTYLSLLGLLLVCSCSGASSGRSATGGASTCERAYERGFAVELQGSRVRLAAVRNPHFETDRSLNDYGRPCASLGSDWRVPSGTYHEGFLEVLRRIGDRSLDEALDQCPVTYRLLDRTCAPCVQGASNCPCTERYVPDWIFCESVRD